MNEVAQENIRFDNLTLKLSLRNAVPRVAFGQSDGRERGKTTTRAECLLKRMNDFLYTHIFLGMSAISNRWVIIA